MACVRSVTPRPRCRSDSRGKAALVLWLHSGASVSCAPRHWVGGSSHRLG